MKLEFSWQIFRDNQIPNFIKFCPVEAKMIHAKGQTDIMDLIVDFRNLVNTPKN
jgi:hypothetical protein